MVWVPSRQFDSHLFTDIFGISQKGRYLYRELLTLATAQGREVKIYPIQYSGGHLICLIHPHIILVITVMFINTRTPRIFYQNRF